MYCTYIVYKNGGVKGASMHGPCAGIVGLVCTTYENHMQVKRELFRSSGEGTYDPIAAPAKDITLRRLSSPGPRQAGRKNTNLANERIVLPAAASSVRCSMALAGRRLRSLFGQTDRAASLGQYRGQSHVVSCR